MDGDIVTEREAGRLFFLTMAVSMIGIFLGIFFLFLNTGLAVRVATIFLAGAVGIISFFRHAVYYKSDQVRMGWLQEHPEFQIEVGYANLAIGIWGLVVAFMDLGPAACGLVLAIYATYLLCTLTLHVKEAFFGAYGDAGHERQRARRSVLFTLFFALVLSGFALAGFMSAGIVPFLHA